MPAKVTGLHKNAPVVEESTKAAKKVAAFVNWSVPMGDGTFIKAAKGFTIFQDEKYPNKHEDMLVALAEKHGGSVEVNLKCRIVINKSRDLGDLNLDDIQVMNG